MMLTYADDTVKIRKLPDTVQEAMTKLINTRKDIGLIVLSEKTIYMIINRVRGDPIYLSEEIGK